MAKKTWHDRIVGYMLAHNYKPTPYRGEKYIRFTLTVAGESYRSYLVGSSGAVRREITWKSSDGKDMKRSVSVTEMFRKYVEKWEDENNGKD